MRDRFTGIFQFARPHEQPEQVFALVTYTPPEVAHALDDLRRRYDPAFKSSIKPHVTIKRPTVLGDPKNLEAMSLEFKRISTQLKPLPVVLDGYNVFRKPDANVVFLKVQDETPFCNLHQHTINAMNQVYGKNMADQYEGAVYHPHLTIGNNLSNLELAVMEHELTTGNYRLHFAFWVTSMVLMTQVPNQQWEIVDTFTFNAS